MNRKERRALGVPKTVASNCGATMDVEAADA